MPCKGNYLIFVKKNPKYILMDRFKKIISCLLVNCINFKMKVFLKLRKNKFLPQSAVCCTLYS